MSDTERPFNLRAEIARIDRDRAETQKLMAETRKFEAEQQKLSAEAAKRDYWLAPALAIAAVIGGLLGAGSFIAGLVRSHP